MKKSVRGLAILRKQKGLTQQQLADLLGMKKAWINNFESFIRPANAEMKRKICLFFDCSIEDFTKIHVVDK
jgi:transcriptional regulator with XRE-family HTH domain